VPARKRVEMTAQRICESIMYYCAMKCIDSGLRCNEG